MVLIANVGDAATSIATVVSTGVLKPGHAVLFAASCNVLALFVFHRGVAAMVGEGLVNIVWAWILAIPASACVATLAYWISLLIF